MDGLPDRVRDLDVTSGAVVTGRSGAVEDRGDVFFGRAPADDGSAQGGRR